MRDQMLASLRCRSRERAEIGIRSTNTKPVMFLCGAVREYKPADISPRHASIALWTVHHPLQEKNSSLCSLDRVLSSEEVLQFPDFSSSSALLVGARFRPYCVFCP
ncbi:unnamed protein product [Pleuronectes platessa]|uniref:Uncharacterized protein n=1 Tax=Pleuronectes platessa TaxID=8262 RepID=A0A9N7TGQ4_PLEPL|nr:unnamed protein product [Pleuronectes platessa]